MDFGSEATPEQSGLEGRESSSQIIFNKADEFKEQILLLPQSTLI
jgi:hypothetical protein